MVGIPVVSFMQSLNILAAHTGMTEQIVWDTSKPSGYIFRTYDVSRLRTAGFTCHYTLEQSAELRTSMHL
jgi:GDP-L-fucose synthase